MDVFYPPAPNRLQYTPALHVPQNHRVLKTVWGGWQPQANEIQPLIASCPTPKFPIVGVRAGVVVLNKRHWETMRHISELPSAPYPNDHSLNARPLHHSVRPINKLNRCYRLLPASVGAIRHDEYCGLCPHTPP